MKIVDLSINRAVTFSMIFLGVIAFGLVSLFRLNPELFPNVTFPVATVITSYSGVGSEDLEKLVAEPIEGAVSTITGVKEVSTICKEGVVVVIVKFEWGTNMDAATTDVRERVDQIKNILPKDITNPLIFKFDVTTQPILFAGISSDVLTPEKIQKLSEDEIEPYLERIEGVARVVTRGGQKRQIQVQIDRAKLEAYGLPVLSVVNAIRSENITSPAGEINEDRMTKIIRTTAEFTSIDQIGKVVVGYRNNVPIYVKDVADVVDTYADRKDYVLVNGKPSVTFFVQKQPDANTVKVVNKIKKSLEQIQKKYQGVINITIIGDNSQFIRDSLANITQSAIQGGLLAILVLFFFLYNIRSVLIIATAIPTSIIATFSIMDLAGVSLNIISMAGLALGLGMLVDNAIVVLENTYRHRQEGEDRRTAASSGASEVAIAITASTLTTVSVFVPVIFVPGIAGVLFKDQALTVTFSLAASLLVSMTLVPLLCSRFLQLGSERKNWKFMAKLYSKLESIQRGMDRYHHRALTWALDHRRITILSVFGLFIVSMTLFYPFRLIGTEFTPAFDEGEIFFNVETPPGTQLEVTRDKAEQVSRIIQEVAGDDLRDIFVSIGAGEGFVALFSGAGQNSASIRAELKRFGERKRSQEEIELAIMERIATIPGIRVVTNNNIQSTLGFGGAPINIEIYGYDRETAIDLANRIKNMVQGIKGAVDVQTSISDTSPELHVQIDRDKAYALGLNVANIASTLQTNLLGTVASRYREGSDEYDILVRLKKDDRLARGDIYDMPIVTPTMSQVPLRNIASIKPARGSITIERKKQERIVTITGKLKGRDMGSVTREIQAGLRSIPIPPGFTVTFGGAVSDMTESFKWLGIALIGAVFLVYAVMASLYESFLTPFIIMFTFPLGMIGVAWTFFLTGTIFSLTAFIGVIVLSGIVVNNGIVMIDYINQLRQRGLGLREAVITGARRRLRPILMTTLTTIFGMFPLALGFGPGAETSFPLARSVIGGLTVSTLLTLIFLPTLYTVISNYRLKRAHRKEQKQLQRSVTVAE